MSYLHCPTCACAYNVAREPACPRCGIRAGTPADPTADIVSAVEQLARAMARATPAELAAAGSLLDARDAQLALPAPGQHAAPPPSVLRAVRAALGDAPTPADPDTEPTLGQRLAALLERVIPERRASWRVVIEAALARLAPRLPATTGATRVISFERVKSRMRSSLQTARTWLARAA